MHIELTDASGFAEAGYFSLFPIKGSIKIIQNISHRQLASKPGSAASNCHVHHVATPKEGEIKGSV